MACANCGTFQVSFYDATLTKILTTTNIESARWSRTLNKVGKLILDIPARNSGLSFSLLTQQDLGCTIEISESVGDLLELEANAYWFLQTFRQYESKDESYYRLTFEDSLSLIDRRIVSERFDNSRDGSSRTLLLGSAADVMVRVIKNFLGENAPNALTLYPQLESISPGFTSPQVEKNISFRRLLGVIQQLANASKTNGVPLYFDLRPYIQEQVKFRFEVYKDQYGEDRTDELLHTSHPHFLLDYFEIDFDQPNVGYVSGGGRSEDRQVAVAIAPEATASPFARRESFKFSTAYSTQVLQTEADNLIADSSGQYKIKGAFIGDLYRKYNFGDRIQILHQVQEKGIVLNCVVNSASGRYEQQELTRSLTLQSL